MTPRIAIGLAAFVATAFAIFIAFNVRLPLPFDGFAAVIAAVVAGLGTLMLVAAMPARWVWHDAERLRHAFQARHQLTEQAAANTLTSIVTTHDRADALRHAADRMRDDVKDQVTALADRLDAAAREIFYVPDRLRALRAVLVRSELIEEAAKAHATLRGRKQTETEEASRAKLLSAVDALDAAFDATDLLAARGLLQQVEVASEVAERVLAPRRALVTKSETPMNGDRP